MIDAIAALLCISGFGLISTGKPIAGFSISAAGSVAWLFFAIFIESNWLILQSLAFLGFSLYGLAKARK